MEIVLNVKLLRRNFLLNIIYLFCVLSFYKYNKYQKSSNFEEKVMKQNLKKIVIITQFNN